MAIKVTVRSGPTAGKSYTFDDTVERVDFGRNLDCGVPFPEELSIVGHKHFALRRELDGYKLVIVPNHPVTVDGKEALDGTVLEGVHQVQLGRAGGPELFIEIERKAGLNTIRTEQLKPSRTIDQLIETARRNVAMVALATVGIIAVLIGVVYGVRNLSREVTQTTASLKDMRGQLVDLGDITSRTATLVDIASVVERVRNSVYLVLVLNKYNQPVGTATAWVVTVKDGQKAFATNGHVAQMFDFVRAKPGELRLIVRAPAPAQADVEIVETITHPGYKAFNDFREAQQAQIDAGFMRPFGLAGGFDIALLIPKAQDGIAEPLTIANGTDLKSLRVGDPIFYVGYPTEETSSVNLGAPSPVSQRAAITNLTSFFFTPDGEENFLIQHALPLAGGASGSPIFNAKGEVVALANAGNAAAVLTPDPTVPEGFKTIRIPLAVLINFAQRADLLRELIDGGADAALVKYQAKWKTELTRLQDPVGDLVAQAVDGFKAAFADASSVVDKEIKLDAASELFGGHIAVIEPMTLQKNSTYLFMVTANDRRPLSFFLFPETGDTPLRSSEFGGPFATTWGHVGDELKVRLAVVSSESDAQGQPVKTPLDAKLSIWRADKPPEPAQTPAPEPDKQPTQ